MGLFYRDGIGTSVNKALAAQCFERAAANGHKVLLADMYADGNGIAADYQKAKDLYNEAITSDNEDYDAVAKLAALYLTKLNDPERGFALLPEAASHGSTEAKLLFGICYHDGRGTAKDNSQALFWWRGAAAEGSELAQSFIQDLEAEQNESSQSRSGGCYIATAVYGSYDCPEVWTLRRFRDYKLTATWHGRLFIRAYYAVSPTVVKLFGKTE